MKRQVPETAPGAFVFTGAAPRQNGRIPACPVPWGRPSGRARR